MAILRQLVVGVSTSRPLATRLAATRPSVIVAPRLLSTNSSQRAQPVHSSNAQISHSHSRAASTNASGDYVDPYKGGPSAIEKAVHLFFFTEIMRGAPICLLRPLKIR